MDMVIRSFLKTFSSLLKFNKSIVFTLTYAQLRSVTLEQMKGSGPYEHANAANISEVQMHF